MKQADRVKTWLEARNTITPLESWNGLGVYRLSSVIYDLKRPPYNLTIDTDMVKVMNQFDEPCHVAEYRLVKN